MSSKRRGTVRLKRFLFSGIQLCVIAIAATRAGLAIAASRNEKPILTSRNYSLPLSFEENRGQADSAFSYLGRAEGFSVALRENEAEVFFAHRPASTGRGVRETAGNRPERITTQLLRMRFLGANPSSGIEGRERLPGTANYFIGNDPSKWRSDIPTFARVRYQRIYPGTDLVFYGAEQHLEFDFRLAPGADPRRILIQFSGAHKLKVDSAGNLLISMRGATMGFHKPVIYQPTADGGRRLVRGSFVLQAHNIVRFRVGPYDRSRRLVIDPILNYSTYFGTASEITAIAVDSAGEAFVTGSAGPLPTTSGSFQPTPPSKPPGVLPPYVAKFNSTGTALLYCTYLAGSVADESYGIALDSNGDAYITGQTNSADFPVTAGAFQPVNRNASTTTGGNAFVTELNVAGDALIYSTFLGGSATTAGVGIVVDSNGDAYVAGKTAASDFPTTAGAFQQVKPADTPETGFVTKLNATGSALVYSTYLHGSSADYPASIAVDSSGAAYVGGLTQSSDFPTTPGAYQTNYGGDSDGFFTKINPSGSGLIYSTYLGGLRIDGITGVALDSAGDAFVTGSTNSADFPVTSGVFQPKIGTSTAGNSINSFVAKFNPTGTSLVYSTLLGGTYNGLGGVSEDYASGIVVNAEGDPIVTGSTSGLDFPVTAGAFESENLSQYYSADPGSFVTKLNLDASALLYSTYLSGTGDQSSYTCDCARAMAIDPMGNVYVAGSTVSVDFPTTLDAVETPFTAPDAKSFVTEFNASEMKTLPAPTFTLSSSANPVEWGNPVTFTATLQGASGTTPTGTVGFSIEGIENSDGFGSNVGLGPWVTVPVDASGKATYAPSSIGPGSPTVAAHYLGDSNDAPAITSMTQTITTIPTTTTLIASANPIAYGSSASFTATVLDNTGKPATGQVWFVVGDTVYEEANLDSSGHATWTVGPNLFPLPVGTDTVTAEYVDLLSPNQYTASSASVVETVGALGVTPAPTLSPAAGTYTTEQFVSLSDASSTASIYYTTNGATPTPTTGTPFSGGSYIDITSTETVQAIAVAPGYSVSPAVSATYIVNIPSPDFSLSVSPSSMSLAPGSQATAIVSVGSISGFVQPVALNCSGLPAGVTCSFSPSSPVPGTTSNLTISASSSASARPGPLHFPWMSSVTFAAGFWWICVRRRRRNAFFALTCLIFLATMNSCGGGSQNSGGSSPPVNTYTITVTGVSGADSHTATLTLAIN